MLPLLRFGAATKYIIPVTGAFVNTQNALAANFVHAVMAALSGIPPNTLQVTSIAFSLRGCRKKSGKMRKTALRPLDFYFRSGIISFVGHGSPDGNPR